MDMGGKMNRAFTVNRVPVGWIGAAEKLNFQSEARGCFRYITSYYFRGRFPGGATGRPSPDKNLLDFICRDFNIQFRRPELVSVCTQTVLPGKTASGGWDENMLEMMLFS